MLLIGEKQRLKNELYLLKQKLGEAEETINAVRSADLDALVISNHVEPRICTLSDKMLFHQKLIDEIQDGILMVAPDLSISYSNRRFSEMIERPVEQILGVPVTDFIPSGEQSALLSLLKQADGARQYIELSLVPCRGLVLQVRFSILSLSNGEGSAIVVSDLSETKRLEELAGSEGLFKTIFESSNDPIFLLDEDWNICGYNARAIKEYQYSPDELLRRTLRDLCLPEERDQIRVRMVEAVRNVGMTFETVYRRKDGGILPVEISTKPFAIHHRQYFVQSVRDISARKRTEDELRLSEQRYRRLIEYSPFCIAVHDKNGFLYINPAGARLFGLNSASAIAGKSIYDFIQSGDPAALRAHIEGFSRERADSFSQQYSFQRCDGEEFFAEINRMEIEYEGRSVYQIIVRDVTEQRVLAKIVESNYRKLDTIISHITEGILGFDLAGHLLYCNPAAMELHGCSSKEELPQTVTEYNLTFEAFSTEGQLLLPEHMPIARAIRGEQVRNEELRIRRRDAGKEWVGIYNAILVVDHSEKFGMVVITINDITERKRLEGYYRQLASIVESSRDAIISVDLGNHIQSWNPGAMQLYGYRSEEMLGNDISILNPINQREELERIQKVLLQEEAIKRVETLRIRKDGTPIEIDLTISPILDEKGTCVGASHISRDITGQKRAERDREYLLREATIQKRRAEVLIQVAQRKMKELETSRRTLQAIMQNIPEILMVSSTSSGAVEMISRSGLELFKKNQGTHSSFKLAELVEQKILFHGEGNRPYALQELPLYRAMESGQSITDEEITIALPDGTTCPFLANASPITSRDGIITGAIFSLRDISQLKKLQREMQEEFRQNIDVLLKEIHHRVKNNMQVISSILSLQAQDLHDEGVVEIFRECQNRVKSMALIHEKLYQSRELSRIDFGQYLRSLATHLLNSYQLKSRIVDLNIHTEHISLDIDTAIPCGLLVNELISNALKHAFPAKNTTTGQMVHGEIHIDVRFGETGLIVLGVADDGIGIPKNIDVWKTHSLGLRLVRTLAEQLNAVIDVSADCGTRWTFTFPGSK